jgi:hypothetical protein
MPPASDATQRQGRRVEAVGLGVLLLALLAVVAIAVACAYPLVTIYLSEHGGVYHHTATVADLDGDGDLDVLLHNLRQEREFTPWTVLTVWTNLGDGIFTPRRLGNEHGQQPGLAATAGDLNGDASVDLVTYSGHQLHVVRNRSGGTTAGEVFRDFMAVSPQASLSQYAALAVGDVNQDGALDVVIAGCCGRMFTLDETFWQPNRTAVWTNAGEAGQVAGDMVPLPALDGVPVRAAALGDLDGDGWPDLFAAVPERQPDGGGDATDRVLFNDGRGGFVETAVLLGAGDSRAVALGDVDGDGDLDALVGQKNGALLWLNQGGIQDGEQGAFARAPQRLATGAVTAVFLADLDGDGDLDAVTATKSGATIWWNDGNGGFTRDRQRFPGTHKVGWAVADFDGDGLPDLFAASYYHYANVWLNEGEGVFGRR